MSWRLLLLALLVVPPVFAWWSGRQVVRLLGDPALGERLLAREGRMQAIFWACGAAPLLAGSPYCWAAIPVAMVGVWVADFSSRRTLFEEVWSLRTYLLWHARFMTGWIGLWLLLLSSPGIIIQTAEPFRAVTAGVLALVLVAWNHRYQQIFLRVVSATRFTPPARWRALLERASISPPALYRLPVPGGRFVNAFALPSRREAAVLFSESLLESFDEEEQVAVLGHEVAHLESYTDARLRRMDRAIDVIALASTVGVAIVVARLPNHASASMVALLWTTALVAGLVWWMVRQKNEEAASDRRGLELCGNIEAVVRALMKLTVLSGLPRRWSVDFERICTHPSLAHRLALVRKAAGIVPAALPEPVIIASAAQGSWVVFESDRVAWLDGVPENTAPMPRTLRESARQIRTIPYAEIANLRVRTSLRGAVHLLATDRAGTSWSVPVGAEDVAAVQEILDRIDGLLSREAVAGGPPGLVVFGLAVILAAVAAPTQAVGLAFLIAIIAVVHRNRPVVAAVAACSASCVVLYLDRFGRIPAESHEIAAIGFAVIVTAASAWLAWRARDPSDRKIDVVLPAVPLALATLLVGAPLAWELLREVGALPFGLALHRTPTVWITAAMLTATLMTARRRSVRRIAATLAAVILATVIVVHLTDRAGVVRPENVRSTPVSATLLARMELPLRSTSLRLSPSGERFAVALPSGATGKHFLVGGVAAEQREIPARDLEFVDDDHVLVVTPFRSTHVVRHVALSDADVARWEVTLQEPPDPYISRVVGRGWAIGAKDASAGFVAAFGSIADPTVTYRRWRTDAAAQGQGFRIDVLSPEYAFLVASGPTLLARMPWGPLAYWNTGQLSETRMWVLHADGERHVATWPGVSCVAPRQIGFTTVCAGWRAREGGVVVWRFEPASGRIPMPIELPGSPKVWDVSDDGSVFAMHDGAILTVLDIDRRTVIRRLASVESGSPFALVAGLDRVGMLWNDEGERVLTVYSTR